MGETAILLFVAVVVCGKECWAALLAAVVVVGHGAARNTTHRLYQVRDGED